ncbi:MAG: alpha/beta hydrolase [Lachnospiraceae bacterium]|nr:alpha/beta hydrolase [Lachnospiraceae bacterium]
MKQTPFPGYDNHFKSQLRDVEDTPELIAARQAQGKALMTWTVPEGLKMEDRAIDGPDEGQKLNIRIYTPAGLPAKAPAILDIHGGAWVGGNLDIDNARCIALATRTQAIVVSVEYRLCGTGEFHFPQPLMDCYTAYKWILANAEEIGCDGQVGLHGSSSGGNLSEGLALYLRDHKEQAPALTVVNCGCLSNSFNEFYSFQQNYNLRMGPDEKAAGAENAYLGGYNGTSPSYYAFPLLTPDVGGLGAHMIITAEYDTLRDDGLKYAMRLLKAGVPTELLSAPRSCHCFTCVPDHPYTNLVHDMIAMSFRREFGLLEDLRV